MESATARAPKRPGEEGRIREYCDCFTQKGVGSFSNAELENLGAHGNTFTPEQKAKLNDAVRQCRAAVHAGKDSE